MTYIGSKPADKVLTASDITDGVVSNAKLAQDIISADTELAVAPASTDELLISDAGVLKRIDYSLIGGANTPAFEAHLSADQSVTDDTDTKATCNTEVFDTDGCYDNSTNYRFLPTTAGKYFVYGFIETTTPAVDATVYSIVSLKVNGSVILYSMLDSRDNSLGYNNGVTVTGVIDMDGSSDYIELWGQFNSYTTTKFSGHATQRRTGFGAYKLIGV